MKKHNFNAGPSILADEVIENAAKAVLDFNGSGLSVLSISHRSKEFDDRLAVYCDGLDAFAHTIGILHGNMIFCPIGVQCDRCKQQQL